MRKNLASALKVTVAQADKIKGLYKDYVKRSEEAIANNRTRNGGRLNHIERRAQRQKLTETASVDFFMVLTFEQRKNYTRIIGKPFTGTAGSR